MIAGRSADRGREDPPGDRPEDLRRRADLGLVDGHPRLQPAQQVEVPGRESVRAQDHDVGRRSSSEDLLQVVVPASAGSRSG